MSNRNLDLLRNSIGARFLERKRATDEAIDALIAAQAAKHSLNSGGTLRKLGQLAETELKLRTDFALDLARHVGSLEPLSTSEFVFELKELLETNVACAHKEIWDSIAHDANVERMRRQTPRAVESIEWEFSTVRVEQVQRVRAEIDLFTAELNSKSKADSSIVNTHGQLKIAAIVAVDIAGYSVQAKADQDKALRNVVAVRSTIDRLALPLGGRVFNTAGDGFMLEFTSCSRAIEAAAQIAFKSEPKVRVGVHAGDVELQPDGNLLGHNVNVADRVRQQAQPGSAFVSSDARRMVRGPLLNNLISRGERTLDKMDETMELFELVVDK